MAAGVAAGGMYPMALLVGSDNGSDKTMTSGYVHKPGEQTEGLRDFPLNPTTVADTLVQQVPGEVP